MPDGTVGPLALRLWTIGSIPAAGQREGLGYVCPQGLGHLVGKRPRQRIDGVVIKCKQVGHSDEGSKIQAGVWGESRICLHDFQQVNLSGLPVVKRGL